MVCQDNCLLENSVIQSKQTFTKDRFTKVSFDNKDNNIQKLIHKNSANDPAHSLLVLKSNGAIKN
tara:strand:+ start:33088 stop:33282 length:195 start_codon:yes stop_codon:yes gene_type:complete